MCVCVCERARCTSQAVIYIFHIVRVCACARARVCMRVCRRASTATSKWSSCSSRTVRSRPRHVPVMSPSRPRHVPVTSPLKLLVAHGAARGPGGRGAKGREGHPRSARPARRAATSPLSAAGTACRHVPGRRDVPAGSPLSAALVFDCKELTGGGGSRRAGRPRDARVPCDTNIHSCLPSCVRVWMGGQGMLGFRAACDACPRRRARGAAGALACVRPCVRVSQAV